MLPILTGQKMCENFPSHFVCAVLHTMYTSILRLICFKSNLKPNTSFSSVCNRHNLPPCEVKYINQFHIINIVIIPTRLKNIKLELMYIKYILFLVGCCYPSKRQQISFKVLWEQLMLFILQKKLLQGKVKDMRCEILFTEIK